VSLRMMTPKNRSIISAVWLISEQRPLVYRFPRTAIVRIATLEELRDTESDGGAKETIREARSERG
jgi:hypothetical protein